MGIQLLTGLSTVGEVKDFRLCSLGKPKRLGTDWLSWGKKLQPSKNFKSSLNLFIRTSPGYPCALGPAAGACGHSNDQYLHCLVNKLFKLNIASSALFSAHWAVVGIGFAQMNEIVRDHRSWIKLPLQPAKHLRRMRCITQ